MKKHWWDNKIAYHIWPKSFLDTNGDGLGDLRGVISKLDYLKELGVDLVYLSPIFPTPFVDQGYDISDYCGIAPEFGTMQDFDRLIAETRQRGMKVVLDMVLNHCSDQHVWFQKALKDPYGKYGKYFYFLKGKNGGPPTNYRSHFGGSAWEPVPGTDLYYLHLYAKEQPDLNWENPELREELFKVVNWWSDKGVAGFRMDAIVGIKKDVSFPDYPPDGADGLSGVANIARNVKGLDDFLQLLKHETFDKHDSFVVGEVNHVFNPSLEAFLGENGHFSTIFDFSGRDIYRGLNDKKRNGVYYKSPYRDRAVDPQVWIDTMFASQDKIRGIGQYSLVIENHDQPRGASIFLPDYAQNDSGVKMLALAYMMLRGIPFIYQGQELGMRNCPLDSISEYNDVNTINQYQIALRDGIPQEDALRYCRHLSRDNARTPVQWSSAENAGFTTGKPWFKVNPNYGKINAEDEAKDPDSVLNFYRKLTRARKTSEYEDALIYGDVVPAFREVKNLMAYYRKGNEHTLLVLANFGQDSVSVSLPQIPKSVLISNTDRKYDTENIALASCEAAVLVM